MRRLLILTYLLFVSITADAASISISPIRLDFNVTHRLSSVNLINQNADNSTFQITPYKWTQVNGKNIYVKNNDLIVTPPIVTIGPNETQIVRVGLRNIPPPQKEITYRIYFQEIGVKSVNLQPNTVRIVLRIGVPVYIEPINPIRSINWQVKKIGNNLLVKLLNTGNVHAKISKLTIYTHSSSKPLFNKDVAMTVLAGQSDTLNIQLNQSLPQDQIKIIANTDWEDKLSHLENTVHVAG